TCCFIPQERPGGHWRSSCLVLRGSQVIAILRAAVNGLGDVTRFFRHLLCHIHLRHIQGRTAVVLDNAGIHQTKVVQAFVDLHERLSLVYLPPDAPELNPMERVWAYANVLGNFCARSVTVLKKKLVGAWQRVRDVQLPHRLMNSNLCRDQ
ncbi:transposase, partial [Deinococcus arenicola]